MDMIVQTMIESLRPLVGSKGWDYCVLWKLSEDQRVVEWINCCCGGAENYTQNNGEEELNLGVSPLIPCRDTMFQHPRTNSCDLLSQFPISMPLDSSGIYAQTLISNQTSWLNFSNAPFSNSSSATFSHFLEESVGTRVLIPLPGGLVELFVNNQISEDQNLIDYVTSQCNISLDHHHHNHHHHDHRDSSMSFMVNMNSAMSESQVEPTNPKPPVSPATMFETLNLSYSNNSSPSIDQAHHGHFQQFGNPNDTVFECSTDQMMLSNNNSNGDNNASSSQMQACTTLLSNETENVAMHFMEQAEASKEKVQQGGTEKDPNNKSHERGRSNSLSDCSDQVDDEDDGKQRRNNKSGKGTQCKNLVAERRRRKKLNERLYTLRSLVPKISKLDRASILGDAIDYVKDLQRQAKELQDELEEHNSEDFNGKNGKRNKNNGRCEIDVKFGPKPDHEKSSNDFSFPASANGTILKQNQDSDNANDKAPQMEPQVEVAQIDGNEFFVKVFCEHKPGRFVRLMEALNSLALEVTNANVTTFRNLVSNVLKVEKKDNKMVVQADHLKDFLLELTRNPSKGLCEMSKAMENGNANVVVDYQQHLHHHHHHQTY